MYKLVSGLVSKPISIFGYRVLQIANSLVRLSARLGKGGRELKCKSSASKVGRYIASVAIINASFRGLDSIHQSEDQAGSC